MIFQESLIEELGEKYHLSETAVLEEVEASLSSVLTDQLGIEVEARWESGEVKILGYFINRGTLEIRTLSSNHLRKRAETIQEELESALYHRALIRDLDDHLDIQRTVISGKVLRAPSNGTISIEIDGKTRMGICDRRNQPVRERGNYREGALLPFYVLRVAATRQDPPRLVINLSRTSKSLVEGLIKGRLKNDSLRIKCFRRIPGSISLIWAAGKIPKEAIQETSNLLKERIKVTWQKTPNR